METLKYSEILQHNKALKETVTGNPFKVSVLSNVTVNSFKEIAEYGLRLNGINPLIEIGNFDNIVQDSKNSSGSDLVIIFYDVLNIIDTISVYFEDLDEKSLEEIEQKIYSEIDIIFNNLKDAPLVVFNSFSSSAVTTAVLHQSKLEQFVIKLNLYLESAKPKNVSIADINKIITQIGIKQSFDIRFYNSSKAPYTLLFFKKYLSAITPAILRITGKLKKAIIFDCDNTLWKGIIGEDEMDKIDMSPASVSGRSFFEVQRIAKYLSTKGIIIGLCSKNNLNDVDEIFAKHPDMQLKNEHIVIKKINWTDKASNLREIAKELNIAVESLVFVDDSSFEINLIKEQIPGITTIQVPSATYEYPGLLMEYVYQYFNLSAGEEDKKRTELYKQQFQRQDESIKFKTIEDYLASLEIQLDIKRNDFKNIPRIAQLTQKTNQFNLTTCRYTESQVEKFMSNDEEYVFSVSVRDKFGDSGLTAICIILENGKGIASIDTLLMSCRVIGRNIEIYFMNAVLQFLKKKGIEKVLAKYAATAKNQQVENFYEKMGFEADILEKGIKNYSLQLRDYKEQYISYIKADSIQYN